MHKRRIHWPLVRSIFFRMKIVIEHRIRLVTVYGTVIDAAYRGMDIEIFADPWEYISPRVWFV